MPKPENVIPHQYKPGESGNPAGRKPGSKNVSTVLKELLEAKDKKDGGGGDYGTPLAKELIKYVFKKKEGKYLHNETTRLRAMEQIVDRLEGKASQPISIQNEELPFEIKFEYRKNGGQENKAK